MEDLELILKHQVCIEVPETECEVVGYTECSTDTYKEPSREDKVAASSSTSWNWLDALQVVGEYFYEQECTRREIEITEVKKHPHCVNMTKVNFPVEQVHKSYTEFDITRTSISLISWKFLLPESVWEAMDSWCSLLERCQLPVSSQKSNPGYTRGNMQHFCKVSIWKKNICREKTWQNCTLVPHPVPTTIEHCACKPTEIWFDNSPCLLSFGQCFV